MADWLDKLLGPPPFADDSNRMRAHSFDFIGEQLGDPTHPLGLYECGYCGAVVVDRRTHRQWHREVDPPEPAATITRLHPPMPYDQDAEP